VAAELRVLRQRAAKGATDQARLGLRH
jgi:hypothetical protein